MMGYEGATVKVMKTGLSATRGVPAPDFGLDVVLKRVGQAGIGESCQAIADYSL
jgi:hypothetical protein